MYFTNALIFLASSLILTGKAAEGTDSDSDIDEDFVVGPIRKRLLLLSLNKPECKFLHFKSKEWKHFHPLMIKNMLCALDLAPEQSEVYAFQEFEKICKDYGDLKKGLLALFANATIYDSSRTLFPWTQKTLDMNAENWSRHDVWRAALSVFNSLRMNTPQKLADYIYEETKKYGHFDIYDLTLEAAKKHISDDKNAAAIKKVFQNHIEKLKKTFDTPAKLLFNAFFDVQGKSYFTTLEEILSYDAGLLAADDSFFVDAFGGEKFEQVRTAIKNGKCKNVFEAANKKVTELKSFWEKQVKEIADYAQFDYLFKQSKKELNAQVEECLKPVVVDEVEESMTSESTESLDQTQALTDLAPANASQSDKWRVVGRNGVIVTGLVVLTALAVFLIITLAYRIC